MKYWIILWVGLFLLSLYKVCFGWGSCSVDDWVLGTNPPSIKSGDLPDGRAGDYIYVPVGTSPCYYEAPLAGEGCVTFWIHDPGNCLENYDPGYGTNGPRWGLQSPLYQSVSVGIARPTYVSGCQGYSPWSTVDPYSFRWFKDGLRASKGVPWSPGWYKWTVCGTWDAISFTIYNVTYYVIDKPVHDPGDEMVTGDYTGTYDATSYGGSWAAVFGEGWKAFWVKGDEPSGIEDIGLYLVEGTGVFEGVDNSGCTPLTRPYTRTTWAVIKKMFK